MNCVSIPRTLAVLALVLYGTGAGATMVLSNVIVHFEPGEATRQDVEIENTGDEPLYVQVTPHVVHAPGTPDERRERISDPRSAGLLVTPNKLVIAPRSRKRLRLVNLLPHSDRERVYRVAVTPVAGELTARESGLKILIGYEVLVLAQPQRPDPQLHAVRDGRVLHLENRGNTNVLLREGQQCETDETPPEQCTALASRRLYPGNRWSVDLPFDRPVEYYLGIGTRNSAQVWQ